MQFSLELLLAFLPKDEDYEQQSCAVDQRGSCELLDNARDRPATDRCSRWLCSTVTRSRSLVRPDGVVWRSRNSCKRDSSG